jgi:F-type H+-transporting ATPase subunit epsilon
LAAKTFRCRLITPAAQLLDAPVTYASIPAWDGLFGVLVDRAPIVAKLGLGELRLDLADKGGSKSYLVEDGFVQMVNNKLTILAAKAFATESLNVTEAQAELAAAEKEQPKSNDPKARGLERERISRARALAQEKIRLATGGSGKAR